MDSSPTPAFSALAQSDAAPQHGPRPLPLFLDMLWRETEGDADFRRRAFMGLRKYQEAKRPPSLPEPSVVARAANARLLRYAAPGGRAPVVFIPSLINPPRVLDLSESRSLLRHMAAKGHDAYLVDWGAPSTADSGLGLDGHVTDRLLPLLDTLERPPIVVGYCLGGTLALGAAALRPMPAVATLAAPWRFAGLPDMDRQRIAALWQGAKPVCSQLGYVPMEVMQSGFWAMDPARTIGKYARFADMEPGSDEWRAFLAVEDWANGGPPLTFAAARDLFEHFYAADATGAGQWRIAGSAVAPDAIACPTLAIQSSTDRIVPYSAGPALAESRTLALGHVGMIVSGRAHGQLWEPLSEWLSTHGG